MDHMLLIQTYREQHVLLVLVYSPWVRDWVCVFNDWYRLSYRETQDKSDNKMVKRQMFCTSADTVNLDQLHYVQHQSFFRVAAGSAKFNLVLFDNNRAAKKFVYECNYKLTVHNLSIWQFGKSVRCHWCRIRIIIIKNKKNKIIFYLSFSKDHWGFW